MQELLNIIQEEYFNHAINLDDRILEDLHLSSFDMAIICSKLEDHGFQYFFQKDTCTIRDLLMCFQKGNR